MVAAITSDKSFEQLLVETPFTKTQPKLWVSSGMGVLFDGFDFFMIGVARCR
jgi:hypothetical protein